MRIALAGLGMAGSYLYRLLMEEGFNVDVYEVRRETPCGLHPCAWGTSRGFTEYVKMVGLEPEGYILCRFDSATFDDVLVPAELLTFDKPRLVRDLSGSAEVSLSPFNPREYDRVIDATGVARAFLPPAKDELVINCKQYRLLSKETQELKIKLGGGGYAWYFPLGNGEVHVGCGSLHEDPDALLNQLRWLADDPKRVVRCGCGSRTRIAGPSASQPFFVKAAAEVWGVGEAIGCVAPLAGDGVLPGMTSARILLDNWEDPEGYTENILKKFSWMDRERKVVDKIADNKSPSLVDARVLLDNSRRMGMRIGILDAMKLLRSLI